jgi:hypothetical protein
MEKPDVGVVGQSPDQTMIPETGVGGMESTTPIKKFGIWTWGSCRRSFVEMVYPQRFDFLWVTRGTGIARTQWFVIDVANMDSRKNLNREFTFVDVFEPIIIYVHGASSCSKPFERVYLISKDKDGITYTELPIEVETTTEMRGRFATMYEVRYVTYNDQKIVLKKTEISRKKIAYLIKIKVEGDKIVVSGDTYEIKDHLKKLGFRWDPTNKVWVTSAKIGVDFVKAELESIPEVIIVEDGEEGQQVEGNGGEQDGKEEG